MKRVCVIVVVMAFVMTVLAGARAGSAGKALPAQDQSGKQKEEEKVKDEPGEKVSGALGTKTNPVRCEDPKGERQYLNRLRCPDGNRPEYSRVGSFGAGPYGNILDGYSVKCAGREEVIVFMDMYHEGHVEKEAVPGFTIVN